MPVARSASDTDSMSKYAKSVPTTSAANNAKMNVPVITTLTLPEANAFRVTRSVRAAQAQALTTVYNAER